MTITFDRAMESEGRGTSFQGYLEDVTYDQIVKAFGQPDAGQDKTQAEWTLRFTIETETTYERFIATIYDWKSEIPASDVRLWNIGGRSRLAVIAVHRAMGLTTEVTQS